MFEFLHYLHMSCAFVSIAGFFTRGLWMITASPLSHHRLTRVLPHLVDTLLLASAIGMLLIWRVSPLAQDWLLAKVLALLLYIALGMVAFRFASSVRGKVVAWLAALATAGYIVSVAFSKSPLGMLGWL